MSYVAAAVVVGGGLSYYGSQQAGNRAADAQRDAAAASADVQREMYYGDRAERAPWTQAGTRALGQLESGEFAKNLQMDPGYEFRLKEGQKAIDAAGSARGNYHSGGTMKALARYGQDYASQEYGNAYNREYGRLSQLAGFGSQSQAQGTQASQNLANNISAGYLQQGQSAAANQMNQSNQMNNLLGQGMMAYGLYRSK